MIDVTRCDPIRFALDAFVHKPQPLRYGAAVHILDAALNLDAVHVFGREQIIDHRFSSPRHQTFSGSIRDQPVADLRFVAFAIEKVADQTAYQLTREPDTQMKAVSVRQFLLEATDVRACIVQRFDAP